MNILENKRGMPDKHGIETTRKIAKKHPDVCISILSCTKIPDILTILSQQALKAICWKKI
jgi:hypothetical protein